MVEPLLMGSYPILSNIPPYQAFISENSGYILKDYTLESINHLYEKILNDELKVDIVAIKDKYSAEAIVSKFNNLYSMISR